MRRTASPTEPENRAALGSLTAIAVLGALVGGLRSLAPTLRGPGSLALFAVGFATLALRLALPRGAVRLARPLHLVVTAVGELMSTVLLSALYFALVWPYAALLRRLGRLAPAREPWPPAAGSSGWEAVSTSVAESRRARPGRLAAGLTVRMGGAVALLRYLRDRPTAYLVPLLLLLIVLGLVALFGNTTGLGPLIYTLF